MFPFTLGQVRLEEVVALAESRCPAAPGDDAAGWREGSSQPAMLYGGLCRRLKVLWVTCREQRGAVSTGRFTAFCGILKRAVLFGRWQLAIIIIVKGFLQKC